MSVKQVCDCCGKDVSRTLFHYRLVAPISINSLDICRDCFYKIRDEIIKANEEKQTFGGTDLDIGDCNICRFAGCSECDDCINGSQWVRMTKEDGIDK